MSARLFSAIVAAALSAAPMGSVANAITPSPDRVIKKREVASLTSFTITVHSTAPRNVLWWSVDCLPQSHPLTMRMKGSAAGTFTSPIFIGRNHVVRGSTGYPAGSDEICTIHATAQTIGPGRVRMNLETEPVR